MAKSKTSLSELLHEIRRIEQSREILTENKIKAIYRSLSKDLKSFLADSYEKYADSDGRFFIFYLDAKNQRAKFLQEIVTNVDNISPIIKKEIETLVDETYKKSYEGMLKAFKKANSEGKFEYVTKDIAVNPNVLKRAIDNNISKLTLPSVLEKHRNEVIYQIQTELNIGLMQGDRYEKMAKRISERLGVSESKAMNITRTESKRNTESGFMDCAENIQEKLEGSDLIYAATWHNLGDERVRPQQMRHTSKGWKKTISKNGANHIKMEGQTVKAGEFFDLGNGVKAKAPTKSGVAAQDCNCRCFLSYDLMTVEEFAKATNQTVEQVRKKYNMPDTKQKQQINFDSIKLTGIDDDYVSDVQNTFESLMNDYPIRGLTVKTNKKNGEFGHFQGQIKGVKRNGEYKAVWNNEICINKDYQKNKVVSKKYHTATYNDRGSKLNNAERVDLASVSHEYGHAIDTAYVLAKNPNYKAFIDKYSTPQTITVKDIPVINDFNMNINKSDNRLSKEIFDELQKEYSLTYSGTISRINDEYGTYAASSISEFLAEGFANMRMLANKDKTDFMKSFECLFNKKFKEVLGG